MGGFPAGAAGSIFSLLAETAACFPDRAAVLGLGRDPLSYRSLLKQAERTVTTVNQLGIGRGDRVALVLPNGPEAAACCYAVACAATSAPLNPAYSRAEFEFYLSDLQPKALIIAEGLQTAAVDVAQSMKLPIWTLTSEEQGAAGIFRLAGPATGVPARSGAAQPEDTALVLHTSGSTSRPKIVPLTQANLCVSARNIARSLSLTPQDRCLNIMPLFHIHGLVGAVLSTFASGGSVVCTPGFHALDFFAWLARFAPTWYTAVPTMHRAIVSRSPENRAVISGSCLRFIRSCSSALPPQLMAEVEQAFGVPLVEAYGMTEASHQMAVNPLPPEARKPGSVGRAAGCEIAILNEKGDMLPAGDVGEVVIRGASVTCGYEGNPEANRGAFVAGWFHTGDQGRLDQEGYLFLTGRSKEIINRGGEKISPREVDEVLLEHPAVASVLTFALPDPRLGEDVGAAVVLRDGATATETELASFVARGLVDFKVPRRIVFLKELPKGPTGKPQRIGLAAKLGLTAPATTSPLPYIEPRTDFERRLAAIWTQVLRCERAGLGDDFFGLGGDSLLATQVIARVSDEFQVSLPMFQLFASPGLEQLAKWIEAAPKAAPSTALPAGGGSSGLLAPLSYSQQRMWFLTQFEESSAAYVIPVVLRLRGELNLQALEDSLQRIVERHEVLRTTFVTRDGAPVQCVSQVASVELPVEEYSAAGEMDRDAAARRLAHDEVHRPFDVSSQPPLRARLVRFDSLDHLLLVTIHHIASDGWSKSVLFQELEAFYREATGGQAAALPPLKLRYSDFAEWQRACMEGARGQQLAQYWKERLAGAPELLELLTDRPRPARQTFDGSVERLLIPRPAADAVTSFNHRSSATLYMTLLAAWQALLSRYSSQTDICVGSPIANRVLKETENLIGAFVNTLVMRTLLTGDPSFQALVGRVRATALGAYDHQDLPLEKLIEVLQPRRSLSYSPLFQVFFQLRNFPAIAPRLEGIEILPVEFDPGTSQFDLYLEVTQTKEGLACALTYNTALFDAGTARRMLGHYRTLLETAVRDPELRLSRLPMLSGAQREQQLFTWNQTAREYPDRTALEIFEEWARTRPSAPAADDGRTQFTYAGLDQRAWAIARRLREAGAGRGALVGLCVARSVDMLAALLGIWRVGAAYVPLDPAYPKERLDFILRDSGAVVLLTQEQLRSLWSAAPAPLVTLEECTGSDAAGRSGAASPEDLAYVVYTSGSTGQPKGVAIRHRSLTNFLCSASTELEVSEQDAFLAITTLSFDIAGLELFLPLITGGRVFIAGRDHAVDARLLAGLIARSKATVIQATPAHWRMLVEDGWTGRPGLKIISGGEALASRLAERLLACGRVWNYYGPTETTIYSTVAALRLGQPVVPIGKPIANTQVYVLDASGQLLPVGVPGELYLGGAGLAEGYWKRPDLTAEQFVPSPIPEAGAGRLYRTGDLVRYLPDGNLEFLRRLDHQVKMRGFRIELGEIESLLQEHPHVRAAAAKVFERGTGDQRLVAFYTSRTPEPASDAELRQWLRNRLPGYMLPSDLVPLRELPVTPSGKVDRKALAMPVAAVRIGRSDAAPLGDTVETILLQIWEEVLNRRPIASDEDFFELGGHSLLGARLLAQVESAFGKRLALASFFEAPTVAAMADILRSGGSVAASRVINVRSSPGGAPLYLLHPSPIFRPLVLALPDGFPVSLVSVFDPDLLPSPCRLEDIAARQVQAILDHRGDGPLVLAGWCADGVLALEMACQLQRCGRRVPFVVMIDSFNPARSRGLAPLAAMRAGTTAKVSRLRYHLANLSALSAPQSIHYLSERWKTLEGRARTHLRRLRHILSADGAGHRQSEELMLHCVRNYEPGEYGGRVVLFRAASRPVGTYGDAAAGWHGVIPDLEVVDVPGNHREILSEPNVRTLADALGAGILAAGPRATSVARAGP